MYLYRAMGEQVNICQLRREDRIFKLEFGQIMGDWGGVPVHLAFGDQFANGGGSEGLGQGTHRLDSLRKSKHMRTRGEGSFNEPAEDCLIKFTKEKDVCANKSRHQLKSALFTTYLDGIRIPIVSFTETLCKDELALVQNSDTHSRKSR